MGDIVEFPSNGKTAQGYLAIPGRIGPGIVVIQEWWGLVDHIKDVCDRFAAEGFVALAPDLYHGEKTTEPDEAVKLLMGLEIERAARDMAGSVDYLLTHPVVDPKSVGTVGFCAGGNLALLLSTIKPVDAVVAFYPYPRTEVDLHDAKGHVLLHIAELDAAPSVQMGEAMVEVARTAGVEAQMHVYPGVDHAFFNDDRPDAHSPDASREAWERTLAFFRKHLK